jgi:hypothetical protein
MRSRRALALGLAIGSLLGVGLYARRGKPRERIDLYFADGSVVSLHGDAPQARSLLAYAREALRAARS